MPFSTLEEFYSHVSNLPDKKSKGDFFEIFTYYILTLIPENQNTFSNVWLYKNFPKEKKEKLHLTIGDTGSDLIVKKSKYHRNPLKPTYEKYMVVQCKYLTNIEKSYTKGKLATFEQDARRVGGGIFVSTQLEKVNFQGADKLPIGIVQFINKDIQSIENANPELMFEILANVWNHFYHEKPKHMMQYINRKNNPRRHYQEECFIKGIEHFTHNNRGSLISATGTGKTFMATTLVKEFCSLREKESFRVVFFVPTLIILSQVSKCFSWDKDIVVINVCSQSDKDHSDILVSTDIEEVKAKIEQAENKKLVVISTYASSSTFTEMLSSYFSNKEEGKEEKIEKFDFMVFDECHNLVGSVNRKNGKKRSEWFYHTPFEEYSEKLLFLTATPSIIEKEKEKEDNKKKEKGEKEKNKKVKVVCMSDEGLFGKTFFHFTLRQGIEAGALSDYRIIIPVASSLSLEYYKVFLEDEKHKIDDLFKNKEKEVNYMEVKWRLLISAFTCIDAVLRGKKRILTFNNFVKDAEILRKIIDMYFRKQNRKVYLNTISGSTKAKEREKILRIFGSDEIDVGIITSVRVLVEGFDSPRCDAICIADSIESKRVIVQMIGRGARVYEDKILDILIPVILREDEEFEDSLENGDFSTVRNVLVALNEEDGRVIDEFKLGGNKKFELKKLNLNNMNKVGRMAEEKWDGKEKVEREVDKEKSIFDLEELKKWETEIIERKDLRDTTMEKVLKIFIWMKENERKPSQKSENLEEKRLGHILSNLKTKYLQGKLSEKVNDIFTQLEWFKWGEGLSYEEKERRSMSEEVKANNLFEWMKVNGRKPSRCSKNPEEKRIGFLLNYLNVKYLQGKLSKEIIDLFKQLEWFLWGKERDKEAKEWRNISEEEKTNNLFEWMKENRRKPPMHGKSLERKLGSFLYRLKEKYLQGKLSEKVIDLFGQLEWFSWREEISDEQKEWRNMSEKEKANNLFDWMKENRRKPSTISKNLEEKRLGTLLSNLKTKYRQGKLSKEIIDLFEQLDWFKW